MKTAAQATTKYVTNGSAPAAAQLWSADFLAALPTMFDKAIAAIPTWQAAVADPRAATLMARGLNRAKNNTGPITTKVQGPAQASFSSGVRVAGGPNGNYTNFSTAWMPAVSTEVTTLNQTNPRGTRAQNRARQAAYDAWIDTQGGNFRQK